MSSSSVAHVKRGNTGHPFVVDMGVSASLQCRVIAPFTDLKINFTGRRGGGALIFLPAFPPPCEGNDHSGSEYYDRGEDAARTPRCGHHSRRYASMAGGFSICGSECSSLPGPLAAFWSRASHSSTRASALWKASWNELACGSDSLKKARPKYVKSFSSA